MKAHIDDSLVSNNDDKEVQDKTLSGHWDHLSLMAHQISIMSLKSSTTMVLVSDNNATGVMEFIYVMQKWLFCLTPWPDMN